MTRLLSGKTQVFRCRMLNAWGRRESFTGQADPPARWVVFVSALPRWFAPPITTVPAEGPSAESFDRSLPRHPLVGADLALVATGLLDSRQSACALLLSIGRRTA